MDLLKNYWFWSTLSAWLIAQTAKIIIGLIKKNRRSFFTILCGSGGMPSAHTAATVSLTTSLIITYGLASPLPVISGLFALVIMTDATAVRFESERHARFLNRMVEEEREPAPDDGKLFKTSLGHTVAQVAVGFAIGVTCALLLSLLPFSAFQK
ncbi:MAG: divergent PAP2 family protein [Ruminococcaceae bacterium]|nr:divergent PAP2 family protein [Oscillospiraceae bacterium]